MVVNRDWREGETGSCCLMGMKTFCIVGYNNVMYLTLLNCILQNGYGASLVAQWLRVCLPMQGTRVRALVWEDPTCHGATRPVSHNY